MKLLKMIIFSTVIFSSNICAASNNKYMEVHKGDNLIVSLESNPSTGYGWMIKSLPKELIFVSSYYEQSKDCKDGAIGCSGTEKFNFIVQQTGVADIKMIYGRAFDKKTWNETKITVSIKKKILKLSQ